MHGLQGVKSQLVRCSRPLLFGLVLALSAVTGSTALGAGCNDIVGRRVILASDAIDPNVFVWDQRVAMVNYAAGVWRPAQAVFHHTILEKPGTHAFVVLMPSAQIHPRYISPSLDALGIKVLSGPDRGRYGWVTEEDAHLETIP